MLTGIKEKMLVKTRYRGVVVSSREGYSFIGGIKRGHETINTNGDIFVPMDLLPGEVVEFDTIGVDQKRSEREGKKLFRTEVAYVVSSDMVPSVINMNPSEVVLYANEQRSIYHSNAKNIEPDKVKLAADNQPFAEVLQMAKESEKYQDADIVEVAEDFMRRTFVNMSSMGVSYSITDDINLQKEKESVEAIAEQYAKAGLHSQKIDVVREYGYFTGVREVFGLMHKEGILKMDAVLPISCMPDLMAVAPVWFTGGKNNSGWTEYFCRQVNSTPFDAFFQLYNATYRGLGSFASRRDIMPVPIMKVLGKAVNVFDSVVIATPYHDLVDWGKNWMRNIDPYLFGFVRGLPLMFLLGRWSGTGLFPLMCDMVADTMEHLSVNGNKIKAIEEVSLYNSTTNIYTEVSGEYLHGISQKVIKAFEDGQLFSFLRGETTPNSIVKR